MTYPNVYNVTYEANRVLMSLDGNSSLQTTRLDMDEANTLIDQLIQATRSALNSGARDGTSFDQGAHSVCGPTKLGG